MKRKNRNLPVSNQAGSGLIIFDCDGTLSPLRDGNCGPFQEILLPNVVGKCWELRQAGYVLAMASNQNSTRSTGAILAQMEWTKMAIGASAYRWSTIERRRKPKPTMLLELAKQFGISPRNILCVGDRETDKMAAQAAACNFLYAKDFFKEA